MASKACLTHPHIGEAIELAHFFGKLQRLPKKCTISFLQRPVSVSQHVEVFMFSNKKISHGILLSPMEFYGILCSDLGFQLKNHHCSGDSTIDLSIPIAMQRLCLCLLASIALASGDPAAATSKRNYRFIEICTD